MIDATLLVVAKLLAGWLLADLLGGLLHWLEDRVLTETMPVIGRYVVAPNRRHHVEPLAFTAGSFLHRNGTTFLAASAVSLVWLLIFGASLVWTSATIGGLVTSMVHYWTHRAPPVGSWRRALQEIGFIQSARQHAQHHRPPSTGRYCVLTDWLNPVLDRLQLWTRLERFVPVGAARS